MSKAEQNRKDIAVMRERDREDGIVRIDVRVPVEHRECILAIARALRDQKVRDRRG